MAEPIPLEEIFACFHDRIEELRDCPGTQDANDVVGAAIRLTEELGFTADELETGMSPEINRALLTMQSQGVLAALAGGMTGAFLAGVMWAEARRG